MVDEVFNPTDPEDVRLVMEIMHRLQSGEMGCTDADGTDVYPFCVCMEGKSTYKINYYRDQAKSLPWSGEGLGSIGWKCSKHFCS
jgi:hypothetical protein